MSSCCEMSFEIIFIRVSFCNGIFIETGDSEFEKNCGSKKLCEVKSNENLNFFHCKLLKILKEITFEKCFYTKIFLTTKSLLQILKPKNPGFLKTLTYPLFKMSVQFSLFGCDRNYKSIKDASRQQPRARPKPLFLLLASLIKHFYSRLGEEKAKFKALSRSMFSTL